MINFTGDIGRPICRDSDGGGSGGGYSGRGGDDSPSEGGRGPGVGLGGQSTASSDSSGRSSSSSSSGGRSSGNSDGRSSEADSGRYSGPAPSVASVGGVDTPGTGTGGFFSASGLDGGRVSSVSNGNYSGLGGQDSPSESAGGPGSGRSGGYSGRGGADSPSESGPGPGGRVGGYSGRGGGYDTPSETSGRGGMLSVTGTSPQAGYSLAAQTMNEVGIGSVGGRSVGSRAMDMASSARAAENQSMKTYDTIQSFLGKIRGAESTGATNSKNPYDAVVNGTKNPPTTPLTDMTIGQVMGYQKGMYGGKSKALGAYQFTPSTLAEAVSRTGVSKDAKFSKSMQDYLAMDLAQNRAAQATVNGKVDVGKFANKLAAEWAGFENSSGKSRYDGVAGNKASVAFADVLSLATAMVENNAVQPGRGFTSAMKSDNPGAVAAPAAASPASQQSLPDTAPTPTSRPSSSALPETAPTPTSRPEFSALPAEAPTPTSRISQFYDPPDEGRFAARYLSPAQPSVEASTTAAHQQLAATIGTTNVLGIDGRTAPYGSITGVNTVAPGTIAPQSTELDPAERADLEAMVQGRPGPYSGIGGQDSPSERGPGPGMGAGVVADDDTSIGEQIGATVIDVGLGMIPGIGTVATIGNIGLTLAGRNTIGQTIMDLLTSGNSRGILSAAGVDTGDGGWSLDLSTDTEELVEEGRPPEVIDFGTRYLGWRDDTRRPTPREKWSTDRGSYGRREYS